MATKVGEIYSKKIERKKFVENAFAAKVLSNIYGLMRSEEFCDVTLHVENRDFNAHKVVLVSSSPYFNAMFCGTMSEKFQNKVGRTNSAIYFVVIFY